MNHHTNRRKSLTKIATSSLIALLVAACGGSSSGDGGSLISGIDAGGAPSRFLVVGPIGGFGSIIVNGVEYDTSQAEIIVDGAPGTEADLAVGQIVTVSGSVSGTSRSAERVEFDDNVQGPIESIDLVNGTMVVLGQTVIVNDATSFDDDISPDSLEGLSVGDVVEVSGNPDADGNIVATRIELEDPGEDFEVTGIVSNHDAAARTFMINALLVDYSVAMLEDFDSGEPADGDLVEVEGNQFGANGELIATEVEFKGDDLDDDIDDDTEIEIEGLITRFVSPTDFDVAGFPVTTDSQTQFEDGTIDDLALNVRIEVDGRLNAQGVLLAREIDFEDDGNARIDAIVDNVDAANNQLTMLGILVEVGPQTRIEDKRDDLRPFSIDDINAGDWLEVRGNESGAMSISATRVERDDAEQESRIRGIARNVAEPSFEILGLAIDTDANTEFDGTTRVDFFATAEGRLVQADGNLVGDRFLATEVEFEEDDGSGDD